MKIVENIDTNEWAKELNNCVHLFNDVVGFVDEYGNKLYNATKDGLIVAGRNNEQPNDQDFKLIFSILRANYTNL